ncbi:MAG: homoserine O-acetyltransferase [Pseudomonadota bacterium]
MVSNTQSRAGRSSPFGAARTTPLGALAPLPLDCGAALAAPVVAYETYGELNADRSNAILLCHALTGDQYAASTHPVTGKPGWWQRFVGPGKMLDTDRYCVICPNVIGSCLGSTGPVSENPETGKPYAIDFPVVTIRDMARGHASLLDYLGVERLHAVIGGSMGGMQVLEFIASFPERAARALPIATAARHSAQNIAFHEVGRQAIMADPDWRGGRYLEEGARPEKGLAVARMAAHITYMSEAGLMGRFGRNLQDRQQVGFGFDADFQIESYLRHQGRSFVERFDANAYLYITRAMDYYDIAARHDGRLADAFQRVDARVCVISFTTDWLYPTAESKHLVRALNAAGVPVSFLELESPHGHDAFLLPHAEMESVITGFLAAETPRGISPRKAGHDE